MQTWEPVLGHSDRPGAGSHRHRLFHVVAGKYVLPTISHQSSTAVAGSTKYLEEVYGVDYLTFEVNVPEDSPLVGQSAQRHRIDQQDSHYRDQVRR